MIYGYDRLSVIAYDPSLMGEGINIQQTLVIIKKKYRIRETPTLSTDADNRTDTNLKRLHDLSFFFI